MCALELGAEAFVVAGVVATIGHAMARRGEFADAVGVPIVLVGVGPGREQIIWMQGERLAAAA